MLSIFRRMLKSRFGAAIALGFVALLGLVFVLTDRSDLMGNGGKSRVADGDVVATIGDKTISKADLIQAAQRDVAAVRQQQPGADMAGYLAAGALEGTLDRLIATTAVRQFADRQGMVTSKAAVDGLIAGIPSLRGIDGKFDQKAYEQLLSAQGITDEEARVQLTAQVQFRNLLLPATSNAYVPPSLALPYADLLLEQRRGQIAFIPASALGLGAVPSDAELQTFYDRNLGRFRVPERRQLRYAAVSPASVAAQAVPSDADIAAAYRAGAADYAAAELRTLAQVIVPDAKAAAALAAKVKAGTPLDQAARAAGLAPATFKDQTQVAYAGQSAPDIAAAAFAAKQGDIVGPLRGPLGFVVTRVEGVRSKPARSLAEVTPELRTRLAAARSAKLMIDKRNAVDDALSAKQTFDQIVAANGLTAQRSPVLTASGIDVDNPAAKPNPAVAPIVSAGFAAAPEDGAQTVPLGQDGSFAVMLVERVLPAAPRPLAQVREAAARAFQIERANGGARAAAAKVVAAVNGGTPLAQALGATGLKLPPPQPVSGPRAQIVANARQVPPPLVLLFAMKAKTAKLSPAPGDGGYYIVYLDAITPGNARGNAKVLEDTRSDINKVIGREYGDQLVTAIQRIVGLKKNAAAIAAVRAQLSGASAPE